MLLTLFTSTSLDPRQLSVLVDTHLVGYPVVVTSGPLSSGPVVDVVGWFGSGGFRVVTSLVARGVSE